MRRCYSSCSGFIETQVDYCSPNVVWIYVVSLFQDWQQNNDIFAARPTRNKEPHPEISRDLRFEAKAQYFVPYVLQPSHLPKNRDVCVLEDFELVDQLRLDFPSLFQVRSQELFDDISPARAGRIDNQRLFQVFGNSRSLIIIVPCRGDLVR
jgi:hypothetical protein